MVSELGYRAILAARLQEWILAVCDTALAALVRITHRITDHLDPVLAGHAHTVPLGLVAAINGKIAVLRRQARGYLDPEYFTLKALQRCALPHSPWAPIGL